MLTPDPALTADPTGYWISWGADDVRLAHVGAAGIDAAPEVIASRATQSALGGGAIAFARTNDDDEQLVFVRALPVRVRSHAAGH